MKNKKAWYDETEKLNAGKELRIGLLITDFYNNVGFITYIVEGDSIENHGSVNIQISNSFHSYSEEHLVFYDWRRRLRILEV